MNRTNLSLLLSIFVLGAATGCEEESYTPRCTDKDTLIAIDDIVPFDPEQLVVETAPDSGQEVRVAPVDPEREEDPPSDLSPEQKSTRLAAINAGCLPGVSIHIPDAGGGGSSSN